MVSYQLARSRTLNYLGYILKFLGGDTIIIGYTTKSGIRYTFYINDNWIVLVTFILTCTTVSLIKRKWKKTKLLPHTRGGSFIEDCIKSDTTYEVIDDELKGIIKRLVEDESIKGVLKQIFFPKGTLVITSYLLFLAQVIKAKANPASQISRLGLDLAMKNLKNTGIRVGGTLVFATFGTILIPTLITKLLFLLMSSASILLIGIMMRQLDCSKLVRELPQVPISIEQIMSSGNSNHYLLDIPKQHLDQTVLLKDFQYSEESKVYILETTKTEVCDTQIARFNRISQKCDSEKRYRPMNEMRRSEKDILRWDSRDNTDEANLIQTNYERTRNLLNIKEKVTTEEQQNSVVVKLDGIEPASTDVVTFVNDDGFTSIRGDGDNFFSDDIVKFFNENCGKLLNEKGIKLLNENCDKPLPTSSNPDSASPLFRNPNRRSKVKIPLHKRTNTFTDMIKEANFGEYPYPSDDIPESSFKPSEKVPEKAE
jgi:hypothetical protein